MFNTRFSLFHLFLLVQCLNRLSVIWNKFSCFELYFFFLKYKRNVSFMLVWWLWSLYIGLPRRNSLQDPLVWENNNFWCPCSASFCGKYFWKSWSSNGNLYIYIYVCVCCIYDEVIFQLECTFDILIFVYITLSKLSSILVSIIGSMYLMT